MVNLTKPVCGKQALGVNLCHILEKPDLTQCF